MAGHIAIAPVRDQDAAREAIGKRAGEEPGATPANVKAKDASWKRWLELLKAL